MLEIIVFYNRIFLIAFISSSDTRQSILNV